VIKKFYKDLDEDLKRRTVALTTNEPTRSELDSRYQIQSKTSNNYYTGAAITDEEADYRQNLHKTELKEKMEALTKMYNSTISINKNKRSDINSLRRERNLYDNVFRNIEYQILEEEKIFLDVLKKHQDINGLVREAEETYAALTHNLGKSTQNDTSKSGKTDKRDFQDNLKNITEMNSAIRQSIRNLPAICVSNNSGNHEIRNKSIMNNMQESKKNAQVGPQSMTNLQFNLNHNRIILIEDLIQQFKMRTEENNYLSILDFYSKSEQINQSLYHDYNEQENEVS
jgi:hypothetical protein